jgi:ethanolamine phosphate transferase 2 subunit G
MHATMATSTSKLFILVANSLIPIALFIFSSGFLPYKPVLPGAASFENSRRPAAIFDRVIIMVVDALRRYQQSCFSDGVYLYS